MMTRLNRSLLAAGTAVLFGVAVVHAARRVAASSGPSAEAAAVLQDDGSVSVRVILSLPEGVPGAFAVDVAGFDSLSGVGVRTLGMRETDVPFTVSKVKGAAVIRWSREPWHHSVPVEVGYTLGGAVTAGGSNDSLAWGVVSPAQEFGFMEFTAVLRCPPGKATVLGGAEATALMPVESGGIAVAVDKLPAGMPLRLMVSLPKGTAQGGFLWVKFMKTTGGTIAMFLLPLASFLVLLAVFWSRGMDPVAAEAEWGAAGEPLAPEIAGAVADEYVDGRDLAAAALDMARAGFLELEYVPGKEGQAADLAVRQVKPLEGLEPHRKALAELLASAGEMGPGEGVKVLDAVYAETARQGFFRKAPSVERNAYALAGAALGLAGILLLAAGATPLRLFAGAVLGFGVPFAMAWGALRTGHVGMRWALGAGAAVALGGGLALAQPALGAGGLSWVAKLGFGLLFSSFFFFAFAPAMPQRTAKGSLEKARVLSSRLGFEMFVPPADKDRLDAEFQNGLPFAVIFRLRTDWIRKFAQAGAPTPRWWKRRAGDGQDGPRPLGQVQAEFLASLDLLTAKIQDLMPAGSGG
ncbi:MAG: DUF2207 domain-containing protein [Elusimicrobia bacterium]|nr:DUF2207 domain-containing protein [Elusimicrobiota bacterium]